MQQHPSPSTAKIAAPILMKYTSLSLNSFQVKYKGTEFVVGSECDKKIVWIARFKRPKEYHFIDSLPKNNYGKVLKTELRKRFQQGH